MTSVAEAGPTQAGAEVGTADAGLLRQHAEQVYADELAALARGYDYPRPPSWRLSPRAVVTYLLGGELPDGTVVTPKYVGPRARCLPGRNGPGRATIPAGQRGRR